MAPKKLIIRVKYKSEVKVFTCYQHEMEKAISSHFKIDMNDVTMFAVDKGERCEVSSRDIRDLMKIEIVPNRKEQKNIQDYMNLDPSSKVVESITSKLQQNVALTGQERKHLIDVLKTHSTSVPRKQKLDHTNIERPVVYHKKCQVNMAVHNKESFSQTDPLNIPSKIETVVSNKEEDKQELKRLWTRKDVPHEQIDLLMQKTFNKRRHYILIELPPVAAVREHCFVLNRL